MKKDSFSSFRKVATVALVLIGLVFAGCEKEKMEIEVNKNLLLPKNCIVKNNNNVSETFNNQERELLSIVIAKSMQNPEFRMFIKEEALKQFDGDYDVLFQNVKDKNIAKGKTIEDFLFDFYLNEKGINTSKSEFKKIIESIPDFQISVPVNCENWDAETEIPLVTYIPVDFDEQTTKYVNAYDYNGNLYTLSTQDEPDVAVVVLGSCERMDYVPTNSFVESIKGNLDSKTARYSGGYEYIGAIKFDNLGYFESWLEGKPEIELRILSYTIGGTLKLWITNPKRKDVNEKWKIYNTFLTRWHFSDYGNYLTWYWQEKDSGSTTTITHTNPDTGQSVSFTTTDESDDIAIETIHKDDTQTIYNGGNFQFTIYWY